ncbi:hypothetical protein ACFPK9_01795 [Rubritalea spongiae]|uniref:Uncharacterized protein n=1 Tax=Rubritalea spongiae TaxID=430797 RepID=A0ABW5E3B7_9BACT
MKLKYTLTPLTVLSLALLTACGEKPSTQVEKAPDDHAGHDHGDHEGHDHGDHSGHDHVKAGPNQGRMITELSPQAEFLVRDDRKIQISFFDQDMKQVAPEEQNITVVTGERRNPTELSFKLEGDSLVSDKPLPMGNNFPTIVAIKPSADSEEVVSKFTLNLSGCTSCDNKEYACECHH